MQLKRLREQAGFTLIELLVAVVLLGIISVPVADLVIQYFKSETNATGRLGQSHDSQITNAYWQQDVSSIGIRKPFDPATNTFPFDQSVNVAFPCSPGGSYTSVIVLAWDQPPPSSTQTSQMYVEYATANATENGKTVLHLVRIPCTVVSTTSGGSTTSTSTLGTIAVLAHSLASAPVIACAGGITSSCTGTGSGSSSIKLTLSIADASGSASPITASFTGQRRQST